MTSLVTEMGAPKVIDPDRASTGKSNPMPPYTVIVSQHGSTASERKVRLYTPPGGATKPSPQDNEFG
jgi:hypothetical protein